MVTRRIRRFGLWIGVMVVLGGLMAAGYTPGQCVPVDPQEPVCVAPGDCDGLAHPDCAGGWTCEDGACAWECGPVCHDDGDCGPGARCELTITDQCCAPGAICLAIYPPCSGVCVPRTATEVELTPFCSHVPYFLGAGGTIPVAVFGETTGCLTYDHAEVDVDGFDVSVRLVGHDLSGTVCPPCVWSYIGLVHVPAPVPGAYRIRVAGGPAATAIASGGVIEEPACQDDCAAPALEGIDWELVHVSTQDLAGGCAFPYQNASGAIDFVGSCQSYSVAGAAWVFPRAARHCDDGFVLFGEDAPYGVSASVCDHPYGESGRLLLGVDVADPAADGVPRVFLLEGAGG